MARLKLATVWLGGCSGCHMSFLDLDEWLLELARLADVVYTPLMDAKEYPDGVDVVLVEGAVANEDNFEMIQKVRERSKVVVAFGDCAVTGNVTALRNPLGGSLPVLQRAYLDLADLRPGVPDEPGIVPRLLERVQPIHGVIPVDFYLPGCPPPAERIRKVLEAVVQGRQPELQGRDIRFG
jgi:NAD-reducing hydrogenase small subunit